MTNDSPKKLLIIRFSSFGDIIQGISVPAHFANQFPGAEVDWLVREDFAQLLLPQKSIHNIISFSRKLGPLSLIKTAWSLSGKSYTHVYDAHNNVRSNIVMVIFILRSISSIFTHKLKSFHLLQRPKNRFKRFLLFTFRINQFEKPFIASRSFLEPLSKWGIKLDTKNLLGDNHFQISQEARTKAQQVLSNLAIKEFTCLVPSAAWPMKRWPIPYWKKLIEITPLESFVILGGPEDEFCQEIAAVAPERVFNLCGKLSLIESCAIAEQSKKLISGDTGLLHVADQMQVPAIALLGPTAFGYPSSVNSVALHTNLSCQPCSKDGRGKCHNSIYQRCLIEVTPERVAQKALSKGIST